MNTEVKTNKKYKDSVFRKLFGENRENALSLYEHQSTYNPNMPLRGLLYFADLYRNMIKDNERVYSKTLVRIPNPKYIVFYNGTDYGENLESRKLHLSDAFYETDGSGDFEWTATLININVGHNKELFQKCQILNEYSIFIQKVRNYHNLYGNRDAAVDRAVKECIEENILKEFLEKQRREAINMFLTEFDEEKFEKMLKEEGALETLRRQIRLKLEKGKSPEEIAEMLELTLDEVNEIMESLHLA